MKTKMKKAFAGIMAIVILLSGMTFSVNAVSGSEIVSYARQFLGYPYVWGTQGPNSFDCSGFVQYVFKHFGISLPASSSNYWNYPTNYGTVIATGSTTNAKAGDLISWSGHIAIYTENGYCIEALNSKYGVTEQFKVDVHTNGLNYKVIRVYGVDDYTTPPADLGSSFYAFILNTNYWKPITYNSDNSVSLETEVGDSHQFWRFEKQSDGSYVITSAKNGNALELSSGNTIVAKPYRGENCQKWYIYYEGDGFVLISKQNEMAVTLSNNSNADSTKIIATTRNNSNSQIWSLYRSDDAQMKSPNMSVSVGDSSTATTFWWNNARGESGYNLKIWKNEIWDGEAYFIKEDAWSGFKTQLPAGTYQVYVDAYNYYDCKMSNVVTFTVPEKTYTVSYNANGGSGAPSAQTKTYGKTLTLSSTKPTRSGYTFLGWSTSSTATTAQYSAGGTYTANSSATLYAVWKANTYTVSYDANGGSGVPSSQTKTYGKTLTLSSAKPTRTGYAFLGWSTSSYASTALYSAGDSYTANKAVTLYAVWEPNTYTVSYNANGGSGAPSAQTKTYGEALTLSSTKPTRSGYNFLGWATSSTATSAQYSAGGTYTVNNAVTLFAVWQKNAVEPTPAPTPTELPEIKINRTSTTSINYGDTLVLQLEDIELPEGLSVEWYVLGGGVSTKVSADGMECRVTSIASGNATITAKIVDADGEPVLDADGNEIFDEITIKSNVNFWYKIVSFFKNLFGINRIIY